MKEADRKELYVISADPSIYEALVVWVDKKMLDAYARGVVDGAQAARDVKHEPVTVSMEDAHRMKTEARIAERKEVALDNYQGQTFWENTNYEGKFSKFIRNNEARITQLQSRLDNIQE